MSTEEITRYHVTLYLHLFIFSSFLRSHNIRWTLPPTLNRMFLFFHSTNSQISVNVSTTTVTTTTEAVRLPLSLTLSSTSEGTICTPSTPSTLARETDDESMEKAGTPDPNQEDDARLAKPYFPTHPFRNARLNSIVNTPSPTRPFFLHSDP